MGCCKEEPKGEPIPNRSGELKIWNEDNSITTISLNERELWIIKASLKETLKRAVNEHGYANGEVKAVLVALVEKIEPEEGSCKKGDCGCQS